MSHYPQPASLEAALPLLVRPDLRLRQLLGEQLVALVNKEPEITQDIAAQFLDAMIAWLNGGNFKVRSLDMAYSISLLCFFIFIQMNQIKAQNIK